MSERLPPPAAQGLSLDQRAAASTFEATRGRPPFGPFATLLHSPELMLRAAAMGEYLRYRSALPERLSEFAILVVSRAWNQPVEWAIHHPIALQAGVSPGVVDALEAGRRPEGMTHDEALVHDVLVELINTRALCDETYARALAAFGERGLIDLVGLCGYYSLLAMVMNTALTEPPAGPRLRALPSETNFGVAGS